MGLGKSSAILDHQGLWVFEFDENWPSRILHTLCVHCVSRCEVGVWKNKGANCKIATGKSSNNGADKSITENTYRSMKATSVSQLMAKRPQTIMHMSLLPPILRPKAIQLQ
jgi:hypothetical protein